MNRLLVTFVTFFILHSFFLLLTSKSYAQYGQYGGPGPSLSIMINKTVGKPIVTKGGTANVDYVDNLSLSDPRFAPGQDVWFRLKVKNTSNINLNNVVVRDYLPTYINPVEGPGTFDATNRIITILVGILTPDQEVVYFLKTRVLNQDQLPSDKGILCVVNKSTAHGDNQNSFPSDEDTSQLCIEKQVTQITPGVSKVPSAGPELGLILLAGQFVTLGAGLYIRKRSK